MVEQNFQQIKIYEKKNTPNNIEKNNNSGTLYKIQKATFQNCHHSMAFWYESIFITVTGNCQW